MNVARKNIIATGIAYIILCAVICTGKLGAQDVSTGIIGKTENGSALNPERTPLSRTEVNRVEVSREVFADSGVTVADIKELTRRSTDVIIGRPRGNISYHDVRTDEMHTGRLIHVQAVLKGKIEKGNLIELELPVGTYFGLNGEVVTRRVDKIRGVSEGMSYFIFMRESEDRSNEDVSAYRLALGMQSMFEISPETNTVTPMEMAKNRPLVKKYENMSVLDFMNEAMTAITGELFR